MRIGSSHLTRRDGVGHGRYFGVCCCRQESTHRQPFSAMRCVKENSSGGGGGVKAEVMHLFSFCWCVVVAEHWGSICESYDTSFYFLCFCLAALFVIIFFV